MNWRLHISSAALSVLFLAGCAVLKLDVSPSAGDWPTFGSDDNRSNATNSVVRPPLEQVWTYNAAGGFGQTSPLIVGEYVVVGTRRGEVHAVSIETGKKAGTKKFGTAINGTPLYSDPFLYVPMDRGSRRSLRAWNLDTGGEAWSLRGEPVATGLLANNENVCFVDYAAVVRCIEPSNGSEQWSQELDGDAAVLATPVAVDGDIVVANSNGVVTMLDGNTGRRVWRLELDEPIYQTPAVYGMILFLTTTRGTVVSVDASSGKITWSRRVAGQEVKLTSPAVAKDELVIAGTDGVVRSLDSSDGSDRWSQTIEHPISAVPLISGTHVFVGSLGNELLALERDTGAVVWNHVLRGRIKSAMAARPGLLVVLSEPRFVYCFRSIDEAQASVHP